VDERLADVGEFGLIARIASRASPGRAIVGIGDDCAVLPGPPGRFTLVTVDMHVENVHFRLDRASPSHIGETALAVNISDIAAMGGDPRYALLSLAARPDTPVGVIDEIVDGIATMAARFEIQIVGGNVTSTDGPLCIDIALLGDVPEDEVVLRNGARAGDLLAVTGTLGRRSALRLAREAAIDAVPPLPVPEPRVAVARRLAAAHLARAMMDISDGLAGDATHLAAASHVGIEVEAERVPVAEEAERYAGELGIEPLELALTGGEDYELLLALAPQDVERAQQAARDVGLTVIGRIVSEDEGLTLLRRGQPQPLTGGWRHF
jgi:thiamine-monophosphate kinase